MELNSFIHIYLDTLLLFTQITYLWNHFFWKASCTHTSTQVAGRIQRWLLTLANYEYKILFHLTHKHSNAEALSKLLSPITLVEEPVPIELILLMKAMDKMPIIMEKVSRIGHRRIQPYLISTIIYKWLAKSVSRRAETICEMEVEAINLKACILFNSRVLYHQGKSNYYWNYTKGIQELAE